MPPLQNNAGYSMPRLERILNALLIYVLMGILIAGYYQQMKHNELPCPLCILQRVGMIMAAFGAVLNLRDGIHSSHYALTILSSIVGGAASLRQICLHICPGSPSFGVPVFGLNLYTWAFLTFVFTLLAVSLMLTLFKREEESHSMTWFESISCVALIVITFGNLISTYLECGISTCTG